MAGPWDNYQPQAAPAEAGPWAKYGAPPPGNAPGTITGNVATMSAGKPAEEKPFQRYQGPAIERATSRIGDDLSQIMEHPIDTIHGMFSQLPQSSSDMAHGHAPRISPAIAKTAEDYNADPATALGDAGTAALTSTVLGKPPGVNLAEASGSTFVPRGIAHPVEGFIRGLKSLPEPDLISAVRHPISSAAKVAMAVPRAIKAGIGEDIRIQPAPREAPAWQRLPNEGAEVPSVINRQPFAQPARIATPEPAPREDLAPGAAGSMVQSIAEPGEPIPTLGDIPKKEWDAGHALGTEVEGMARPRLTERIGERLAKNIKEIKADEPPPEISPQEKSLLPLLKKSLAKVQAEKAARLARPN